MEDLAVPNGKKQARLKEGRTVKEYTKAAAVDEEDGPVFAERSPVVSDAPNIPVPPFWGVRVKKDFDLREIFPYINETALFKNQWQLKTASQEDYARLVEQKYRPIKKQLEEEIVASGIVRAESRVGIFSGAERRQRCGGVRATRTTWGQPPPAVQADAELGSRAQRTSPLHLPPATRGSQACASRTSSRLNPPARWM